MIPGPHCMGMVWAGKAICMCGTSPMFHAYKGGGVGWGGGAAPLDGKVYGGGGLMAAAG